MADDHSAHSPLDDAIDRAVREMTNVDPAPGFDGRVTRRLDRRSPQRFGWPRLAAAAGAVAMLLVLAIFLTTGPSAPVTISQHPPVAATATPPQAEVQPPTATSVSPSIVRTTALPRRRDARGKVAAASVNESPITTIPALEPPDPLAVDDLEQRAVNVPAIPMPTLDVRQLNLEPLRTFDERPEE